MLRAAETELPAPPKGTGQSWAAWAAVPRRRSQAEDNTVPKGTPKEIQSFNYTLRLPGRLARVPSLAGTLPPSVLTLGGRGVRGAQDRGKEAQVQPRLDWTLVSEEAEGGEGQAMGSRSIQDAPWRCPDLGGAGWEQHPPCLPGTQEPSGQVLSQPLIAWRGVPSSPPRPPGTQGSLLGHLFLWTRKAWSGQARAELPDCDPFLSQDSALRSSAPICPHLQGEGGACLFNSGNDSEMSLLNP